MNAHLLLSKFELLQEYFQQEVADYIDYLISKQNKIKQKYPDLSEKEMGENIELSAVNDSQEDYLTEKEVSYYLKLKDEH